MSQALIYYFFERSLFLFCVMINDVFYVQLMVVDLNTHANDSRGTCKRTSRKHTDIAIPTEYASPKDKTLVHKTLHKKLRSSQGLRKGKQIPMWHLCSC